jgi:hypothetical protein
MTNVRQDKIDLTWERISHETKESGSWLFRKYKHLSSNCHERTDAPSVFLINIVFKHPVALIYHFTYISVLNATYYVVTLLPHYIVRLYTAIIRRVPSS